METKNKNRAYRITIRFTEEEFNKIQNRVNSTLRKEAAAFIRAVVLEKPVTVKYRNQSLDEFMEELIQLRKDFNAVGNNFNQVVRKINSVSGPAQKEFWLSQFQVEQKNIADKVERIKEQINKFSAQWFAK